MAPYRVDTKLNDELEVRLQCRMKRNPKVLSLVSKAKDLYRKNHSNKDEYEYLIKERVEQEQALDPNCKAYLFEPHRWDAYVYLRSIPKTLEIKLIIAERTADKHKIIKSFIEELVVQQLQFRDGDIELKIQSLFGDLDIYNVHYSGTGTSIVALIVVLIVLLCSLFFKEYKVISALNNYNWVYDFITWASLPVSLVFITRKTYIWKT